MSGEENKEVRGMEDGSAREERGAKRKPVKIFIVASACALAALVAASALFLSGKQEETVRIVDFGRAFNGVSVGGVDISGMTRRQALSATAGLEGKLLGNLKFTLDVNGTMHEYGADDMCVITDYEDALSKALMHGHEGSFEERRAAIEDAASKGADFPITLSVDEERLKTRLAVIKGELDTAPQDAAAIFTPWGHLADGTPYAPDLKTIKAIVGEEARGRDYGKFPALERIDPADMPNKLRYKFWRNSKYVDGYVPPGWDISRFVYRDAVTGVFAKTDEIKDDIVNAVKTGDYSAITVPCEITSPSVTLEEVKANTQLISSWTSSFSEHYGYNRNWNVAMISSLINNGGASPQGQAGSIIRPGETWSANLTAGPRDSKTAKTIGWKKAAGIQDGGFNPQVGGGVCQLGSTTYNAAIRSGLTVAEFNHHSIPSNYIPIGLDATLNTKPNLDLKLRNDNPKWNYYIVSYVNPKDKNVTVEIYGPPVMDAKYGNVIYDYVSKRTGRYGSGKTVTRTTKTSIEAPDGTRVDKDNPYYKYSSARSGTTARIWRRIYAPDGTMLAEEIFSEVEKYPPVDGVTYMYVGN